MFLSILHNPEINGLAGNQLICIIYWTSKGFWIILILPYYIILFEGRFALLQFPIYIILILNNIVFNILLSYSQLKINDRKRGNWIISLRLLYFEHSVVRQLKVGIINIKAGLR